MSDADRYWEQQVAKLRQFKGLRPLTSEEAEQALEKMSAPAASDDEIDAMVKAVLAGKLVEIERFPEPEHDWSPEVDHAGIESDAVVLFRNEGEDTDETKQLEDELLEELLNDDESENDDDLES